MHSSHAGAKKRGCMLFLVFTLISHNMKNQVNGIALIIFVTVSYFSDYSRSTAHLNML